MNEILTTKDKLRNWLNAGNAITVLEATTILNTVDLRQYITQLRREFKLQGKIIEDEWKTNEKTGKRFKKYWLKEEEKKYQEPIIQPESITPGQQTLKFG